MVHGIVAMTPHSTAVLSSVLRTVKTLLTVFGALPCSRNFNAGPLVADSIERERAEHGEEMDSQNHLLRCNPARFLLVGACVAVEKPGREFFECRHLLLS